MIYAFTYTAYVCAGAVTFLGFIKVQIASFPAEAKPALAAVHLCRAEARLELYDPARREAAYARARAVDGTLRRCRGVVCKDVPKITRTTVTIDDHPEEGP